MLFNEHIKTVNSFLVFPHQEYLYTRAHLKTFWIINDEWNLSMYFFLCCEMIYRHHADPSVCFCDRLHLIGLRTKWKTWGCRCCDVLLRNCGIHFLLCSDLPVLLTFSCFGITVLLDCFDLFDCINCIVCDCVFKPCEVLCKFSVWEFHINKSCLCTVLRIYKPQTRSLFFSCINTSYCFILIFDDASLFLFMSMIF